MAVVLAPIISTHSYKCAPNSGVRRRSGTYFHPSGASHTSCTKLIPSTNPTNALCRVSMVPPKMFANLFPSKISAANAQRSFVALSVRAEAGTNEAVAAVEGDLEARARDDESVRAWHTLPSGLRLEVLIHKAPETLQKKPPLVFVHGSYHAAWCWAVHWLPYFSSHGYDCYGVSLLGQGASNAPVEPGPAGTIQTHACDIAHFISCLCERPPVLIGHSFGGLIVQYYLSQMSSEAAAAGSDWGEPYPRLAGAVLACSVPPTGNSAVVKRFLMSKPIASIKVTLSLAAKWFATSVPLCRETFFSPDMPEGEVAKYQMMMKESSRAPLFDLRKLNNTLPVPPPAKGRPPILVVGAENDYILDKQGIEETARFLGTKEVIIPSVAHDIMLDTRWRDAADVLVSWMSQNVQSQ